MARKKIISLAMAALLTASSLWNVSPMFYEGIIANANVEQNQEMKVEEEVTADASEVNGNEYGLVDNIQDGAILHCFDWKFSQIKEELPNIAAAGFSSVQTSPAQRADGENVWYMLYQPQSFSIAGNVLGNKKDLEELCTEADKYGIKVIVDVVANHLRGDGTDVDSNLSRNNHNDYWHHDDYDSNKKI